MGIESGGKESYYVPHPIKPAIIILSIANLGSTTAEIHAEQHIAVCDIANSSV